MPVRIYAHHQKKRGTVYIRIPLKTSAKNGVYTHFYTRRACVPTLNRDPKLLRCTTQERTVSENPADVGDLIEVPVAGSYISFDAQATPSATRLPDRLGIPRKPRCLLGGMGTSKVFEEDIMFFFKHGQGVEKV